MLRRFCKNLERYCLMVFIFAIALGGSVYIGCIIRWVIMEPGGIPHEAMVMMAMSGVGVGMLLSAMLFGFFGKHIMLLIKVLDDFVFWMSNCWGNIICYIYERRERKARKSKLGDKILNWLEDLDVKLYEKEEEREQRRRERPHSIMDKFIKRQKQIQ